MRVAVIFYVILLAACTDRPSDAGLNRPPPPPPEEKRMDLFDSIDAAVDAAKAEESAIDDPRVRQRLTDSLHQAQEERMRKRREERSAKP
jgi:hypothetical protein